jgi:hypothetical protein
MASTIAMPVNNNTTTVRQEYLLFMLACQFDSDGMGIANEKHFPLRFPPSLHGDRGLGHICTFAWRVATMIFGHLDNGVHHSFDDRRLIIRNRNGMREFDVVQLISQTDVLIAAKWTFVDVTSVYRQFHETTE